MPEFLADNILEILLLVGSAALFFFGIRLAHRHGPRVRTKGHSDRRRVPRDSPDRRAAKHLRQG